MRFDISVQSDIGSCKKNNQDGVYAIKADTMQGQIILAVVCDGVGGLSFGEEASAKTILEFKNWVRSYFSQYGNQPIDLRNIENEWRKLIFDLNKLLVDKGREMQTQIGTTLTAMLIVGGQYIIAHVGDSRAYEISSDLVQLTKDQTFVAREVELGRMTMQEALVDERRHMLLQCVGQSMEIEPLFFYGDVKSNTNYLLCSDGFYNSFSPQEIMSQCVYISGLNEIRMDAILMQAISVCKDRNEKDNISAIMISVCE